MTKNNNHFRNKVFCDDSLKIMSQMPDNSVSSIVCDPPYGLEFMGKDWDKGVPPKEYWREALRVAKPGAFLLAFGGTRTHHHLMTAIENSGWQIRDCLMWLYGSGFPKSYDIGKGIDKKLSCERKVVGTYKHPRSVEKGLEVDNSWGEKSKKQTLEGLYTQSDDKRTLAERMIITSASSEQAKLFDGYGTALKPAYEPIIIAMKPVDKSYVDNALTHGIAGINIDESRIKLNGDYKSKANGRPSQIGLDDNYDPEKANQPDTKGRFPANVLFTHHEDCKFRGYKKIKGAKSQKPHQAPASNKIKFNASKKINRIQPTDKDGFEKVEMWECSHDCPIKLLDEQSGITTTRADKNYKFSNVDCESDIFKGRGRYTPRSDKGGASRFFYCSKASTKERNSNLPEGIKNKHPTVKPQKLMQYLIKLVTPPKNGIILDPFCGSGSTLVAAKELGVDYIGIDNDPESVKIAKYRIQ